MMPRHSYLSILTSICPAARISPLFLELHRFLQSSDLLKLLKLNKYERQHHMLADMIRGLHSAALCLDTAAHLSLVIIIPSISFPPSPHPPLLLPSFSFVPPSTSLTTSPSASPDLTFGFSTIERSAARYKRQSEKKREEVVLLNWFGGWVRLK